MMKRILALAMMLCLFAGAALAEQILPAEKSRILPGLPPGMVAACTMSNGKMDIVIDRYKTDWDMVATAAKKSGSLTIHPGIQRPQDAEGFTAQSDYYRYEGMTVQESEQRVMDSLIAWSGGWVQNASSVCSRQGWAIGRYDEGTGLFIPLDIPSSNGAGTAVRWKMKDGTYRTERVRITVRYSDDTPVYTRRRDVRADAITAGVRMNEWSAGYEQIRSAEKKDGSIVYRLNGSAKGKEVHTAVSAPDWLKVEDGWKAYRLGEGAKDELTIHPAGTFGMKNPGVVLFFKISGDNIMYKRDWAIEWVDEEGDVQAVFGLEALFIVGDPAFSAAYAPDTEPLPASALSLETENPLDAFSISYDEATGELHMAIDEKAVPSDGKTDLSVTAASAKVTVPSGAAACRVTRIRGDVIYGNSGEKEFDVGVFRVQPGQKFEVPELTRMPYLSRISVTLHNGKYINLFFAPSLVGRYGGQSMIMEWLDEKGMRIGKRQQVTLTTDAYDVVERMSPSMTKNPNAQVDEPSVKMGNDGVYVSWTMLPQMGENIRYYDIVLEDGNGGKVYPDAPVLLYLPYPDGKTMEACMDENIAVYHQLNDGSYEEYSTQNGRLIMTPYGLCMEVSSFSPYYVVWDPAASSAAPGSPASGALPKTGDSSSMALWISLLGLACAGTILLRRRVYGH